MKFLTKQEFENLLSKLCMNKNKSVNNQNKEKIEKIFYETSQIIQHLCKVNSLNHSTYGISMTLFHYYIAINNYHNIDKYELAFACFYMSSKIQMINLSIKEIIKKYNEYIKNKFGNEKKPEPDFVKYEIQLYSQLGYDLDFETPYDNYYKFITIFLNKFPLMKKKKKIKKLKCLCFNLIDDTYQRPFSIYFHPKIIFLGCFIFSIKFLEFNECNDIGKIIEGENVDLIGECMEFINDIYDKYIENSN